MKMYFFKIVWINYELLEVGDNKLQPLPLGVPCAPKKGPIVASSRSYVHHDKTLTTLTCLYYFTKAPFFKIFKHYNQNSEKSSPVIESVNHFVFQCKYLITSQVSSKSTSLCGEHHSLMLLCLPLKVSIFLKIHF